MRKIIVTVLATLQMDEKQHVVGHQPSQLYDLRREEVGSCQHRQWI